MTRSFPAARRLNGGNDYDDIRIDIPASFADVRKWLSERHRLPVVGNRWSNTAGLARAVIGNRLSSSQELLGLPIHDRQWFLRFQQYWSQVLGGVKIDLGDFFFLRSIYRQKCEDGARLSQINWDDGTCHLANWQHPTNLFHTFHFALKDARVPVKGGTSLTRRTFGPGKRALEFGCGLAPMYAAWRRYYSHVPMQWTILDIENFPFHYACRLYGNDASCECVPVAVEHMDAPLPGQSQRYDVIYCQEVLEHSHAPLSTAQYLLDHLATGGTLVFDYMQSDGHGLDTPAGVEGRQETIAFLRQHLMIVHPRDTGTWDFQSLTLGIKPP